MHILWGKITDRIRGNLIPPDAVFPAKRPASDPPSTASVKNAKGRGLGKGATRKRSGEGARTSED